jgi:hypothetical protein
LGITLAADVAPVRSDPAGARLTEAAPARFEKSSAGQGLKGVKRHLKQIPIDPLIYIKFCV